MTGAEMFRTVNYVDKRYNPKGIGYTAPQIANQVMKGGDTRVSDTGGSVYGRGIYFADSYSHSTSRYGDTSGNVKATAVMRAKLNNNAKVNPGVELWSPALQADSLPTVLHRYF